MTWIKIKTLVSRYLDEKVELTGLHLTLILILVTAIFLFDIFFLLMHR